VHWTERMREKSKRLLMKFPKKRQLLSLLIGLQLYRMLIKFMSSTKGMLLNVVNMLNWSRRKESIMICNMLSSLKKKRKRNQKTVQKKMISLN